MKIGYRLLVLALCVLAAPSLSAPLEPQSGFEWDLVDDPRVIGYRVYIDGERNAIEIPQGDTDVDCAELNLENGPHSIHVTAYSEHQESAPSNTLEFIYDGSLLMPPNLKLKLTIEVGQ